MIELTETPTFVVGDAISGTSNIKLFDYFDLEGIPYEVLDLSSAEALYREIVYYPIVLNDDNITPEIDFDNLVNPQALYKAQDESLIIVFIYDGVKDLTTFIRERLMRWIVLNDITIKDVRFISNNKMSEIMPPFIYFPFSELDAYIEMKDRSYITSPNGDYRENIFTCQVSKDTAHSRIFAASLWYHAFAEHCYFDYADASDISQSPIYKWDKHWSATSTLMDMFGQQLPISSDPEYPSDVFNEAYWNFIIDDSFNMRELSISKDVFAPIINQQPFILIGPPGQCKLLKSLGYETFDSYINEIHDTITDDETRMQALFRLLYEMVNYDEDELVDINQRIAFICKHNQEHFLSSKRHRLLDLLKKLHDGRA